MKLRGLLEEAITKSYSEIIDRYGFKLIETYDQGMGALNSYQNKDFRLRIINDRGLLNAELASNFKTDYYLEVDLFHTYIRLTELDTPNLNKWDKKVIASKRLACEEEIQFIKSYYDIICKMLSIDAYQHTINSLTAIADEYNQFLFGKPKSGKNAS